MRLGRPGAFLQFATETGTIADGPSSNSSPGCSLLPLHHNTSRLGNTSAASKQQLMPMVSTRPRLCSPWWLAIIRAAKPTIVVSELIITAVVVGCAHAMVAAGAAAEVVDDVDAVFRPQAENQRQHDHVGRIQRNVEKPIRPNICSTPTPSGNMASKG